MTHTPITIAIDGLAATGKGTIARHLAEDLDFAHLDTGVLYRAVGVSVLKEGGDPSDPEAAEKAAQALDTTKLSELSQDPMVRSDEGGAAASKVAAMADVRAALLKFQKDFVGAPPEGKLGCVLDGRDIGTVIAPDAKVKIFVSASPEIRAHRRFLELQERGENVTEADVLEELKARDARDMSRDVVPTKAAEDAVHLDTSELTIEEAVRQALLIVKEKLES